MSQIIRDIFIASFHAYNTRTNNKLRLPLLKYEFSRTTIQFTETKCWNNIPEYTKEMPTLSSFKRNFKSYLLSHPQNNVGF